MSNKMQPKNHVGEESVEAKHSTVTEPSTLSGEAKKLADEAIAMMWNDMLKGSGDTISEQVFGGSSGDLKEGHAVSLKKTAEAPEKKEKKAVASAEHMEYFREVKNADRIAETRTESQVKSAVEEIRMEIKKLISTSKIVERTVKDATADKAPVKPGKYHLNFFEFVLSVLRDATQKLEDTATYGAVFTSKKQQSKYWNSYKKHGTSFGLSGERSVVTQTG